MEVLVLSKVVNLNHHQHVAALLVRYLNNECTPEEAEELFVFLQSPLYRDEAMGFLSQYLSADKSDDWRYRSKTDHIFQKLKIESSHFPEKATHQRVNYAYLKVMAMILTALTLGWAIYYLNLSPEKKEVVSTESVEDALPGESKATLVFSDGKQINLAHYVAGDMSDDIVIKRSDDGQLICFVGEDNRREGLNTIRTPPGGQYRVVFPDGSKVWLNAASSIMYPASFRNRERYIRLSGEAYFEIAPQIRNKEKVPFVVETNTQKIEVLGTRFNVESYEDDRGSKTTLIEGKVRITTDNNKNIIILKPSEEIDVNPDGISTKKVDVESAIDWKNGDFIFVEERIQSIMRRIARWYDVRVIYESKIPEESLSGQISRNKNLSEVLRVLELSGDIRFRIENGAVYISADDRKKE